MTTIEDLGTTTKQPQITTNDYRIIPNTNDAVLFRVANALLKGHFPSQETEEILRLIAYHGCATPYPEQEISPKIEEIIKQQMKQTQNLSQEVREWV